MCQKIMSLKVREPWRGRQAPQEGDWCRGEWERVWGRPAQPGTHPVSLGSSDTSCSPLAGHALQTWRALSPRGAGWASCALCGRGLWWAAPPPGTQSPLSSPSSSAQTPLGLTLHPSLLSSSSPKPPPLPPRGPHRPHLLWDHPCQECRGGRGAPGGPGNRGSHVLLGNLVHPGAETSRTHQAEAGREWRAREMQGGMSGAGLVGGRGGGGPGPGAAVLLGQAGRTAQKGHLGMANRTLTLGPTRPGAPASPGTP